MLEEIAFSEPWIDLALATGDLAQDPDREVYERLARVLGETGYPVQCLPGNHDNSELLDTVLSRYHGTSRVLSLGDWVVILVDSTRAGNDSGYLSREELDLLDETLLRHPAPHALVALHHHPIAIGSPWLDRIGLLNAEAFFEVLDAHSQVRAVLFGHIHQEFVGRRNEVLMLGSPSTCVQFAPRRARLRIDSLAPAYRWLELGRHGEIATGVGYIEEEIRRRA